MKWSKMTNSGQAWTALKKGGGLAGAQPTPFPNKMICVAIPHDDNDTASMYGFKNRGGWRGSAPPCINNMICISIPHCKHGDTCCSSVTASTDVKKRRGVGGGGPPSPPLQTTRKKVIGEVLNDMKLMNSHENY